MHEAESPENLPLPPANTDGDHPYALLRNRDFALYLIGRLVAVLGQQMFVMALGWEIYDRTGSAMALGLVGLTQMIPMFLFTLPAGHVADNYNRCGFRFVPLVRAENGLTCAMDILFHCCPAKLLADSATFIESAR